MAHTEEPYRIAVCNQKGGVGKSTLALNLAGALASVEHDVLVIDMDPNGHMTVALDHKDAYVENEDTLYGVLANEGVDLEETIVEAEEFDFVPSNIAMFSLQRELISMRQGELQLKKALDTFVATNYDAYDFVIVDCPPSLSLVTDNAIVATERLLVPVEASEIATHAMELLVNQIDILEENFDVYIERLGIVIMNVEHPPDGEERKMIEWFEDTFGDAVPVYEVRKRVAISRAWNNASSIFAHDEECNMEENLLELAGDIANDDVEVSHSA